MAGDIEANSTKGQMQRKTRWSGLTGLFFLLWTVVAGVDISYPLYTNGIHWKNSEISAVDWTLLVERFVGLFMILLATPCAIFSIADTSLDQWGLLCVLGFSIQSFCISILILGTVYFNSLLPLVFEASLLLQDSASMYFSVIFSYGGTLFIAVAFAALEIAGMLFALKVAYPRRLKGRSGYCYGGAVGFGFGLSTFLVSSFIQHVELIPINCGLSHDVVHTMSQRGGLVFVKTCAGAILGSNVLRSSRTEVAYDELGESLMCRLRKVMRSIFWPLLLLLGCYSIFWAYWVHQMLFPQSAMTPNLAQLVFFFSSATISALILRRVQTTNGVETEECIVKDY